MKTEPRPRTKAPLTDKVKADRELLQRLAGRFARLGGRDRKPSAGPYLRIPLRPAGAMFWENLSIGMNSPLPVGGLPTILNVTVLNTGALPALATIAEFRWGNPSLGLSESSLHPAGKSIPSLAVKGTATEIHSATPWIPQGAGHQCLMVTCWAVNDRENLKSWQPQIERRSAQRNVTVAAMQINTSMPLELDFANLFPMRAVHTVMTRVDRVTPPRELPQNFRRSDLPMRVLGAAIASAAGHAQRDDLFVAQPAAVRVRSRLSEGRGTIGPTGGRKLLAGLLTADDQVQRTMSAAAAGMSLLHEVPLHPYELRSVRLELEIPPGSRRGDFLVYRTAQMAEGLLLGGYTAVLQVE